jgi:exosortase D (VPLPA-CTERM-specific)
MAMTRSFRTAQDAIYGSNLPGLLCLGLAVLAAGVVFSDGITTLLVAWQLPEYSHGPLIPLLSLLLFLRHLKRVPIQTGPVTDRGPGLILAVVAIALGLAGSAIGIGDIVAYGMILWVGALLLISLGWREGRAFWAPIVHLVYMLPLPGALYYGVSTYLQGISSELGVYFLHMLRVPVFLEGNIIDLGAYKLQVAEACSGLRYLFPILSFSYVFAILYRGPVWHKIVLLVAAAPITILMNSVRIAVAGVIVRHWGVGHVEGFTHFFEGWVIFLISVALLWLLAWMLLRLRRSRSGVFEALDLETEGLGAEALRLRLIEPSRALMIAAVVALGAAAAWQSLPERAAVVVDRDPFALFPRELGAWQAGPHRSLDRDVERILAADDYHSVAFVKPGVAQPVDLLMVWYSDQMSGGVHSPDVCLPGGGWEIADLQTVDLQGGDAAPFSANRAIIQQGVQRMLVYYWFEQQGQRTASEFEAKLQLMVGKVTNGRNDSALVRLITPMDSGEAVGDADARLQDVLNEVLEPLSRFIPAP